MERLSSAISYDEFGKLLKDCIQELIPDAVSSVLCFRIVYICRELLLVIVRVVFFLEPHK